MPDTPSGTGLPTSLVEWIEAVTGSALVSAVRMAGGGRKQAWFVDVDGAGGVEQLFLRWDPTGASTKGDPWTVRREAEVYRALDGSGLPVARFVGLHPTAQAMLVTRLPGSAAFSKLRDEAEREAVASEFMHHLAALHRLDPRDIGLLAPGREVTATALAVEQLDEIEAVIAARPGRPEPVLELALRWLRDNVPAYDGPIVVVQGDTGPGNFMFDAGAVTAIVDWELAHLGDPMDDLAWVSLRSTQDPFPELPRRFAEYETASGYTLDYDRIRYYRVMAEAKILAMNHGVTVRDRSEGEGGGGDPGARLIFAQLHRRLCAEALADVMGLELDTAIPLGDREATEDDELFALVLSQLRDVVTPRITDSFASQRIKGLARALKYLAKAGTYRSEVDAGELADLADVLGHPPDDPATGRAELMDAVAAGRIPAAAALRAIYRGLLRTNELLRDSSGVLADRHYLPLPARAPGR